MADIGTVRVDDEMQKLRQGAFIDQPGQTDEAVKVRTAQEETETKPAQSAEAEDSDGEQKAGTEKPGADNKAEEDEPKPVPRKPNMKVTISSDSMTAVIEFSRISTEIIPPTEDEVRAALKEKGVDWGIDDKYLSHICLHVPFTGPVEIAKGVRATVGRDGYLKYLIETKRDLKPKERPDGTMDYYDLGYIQSVVKDQPLCEVHDPEKGQDGHNVYGMVLEGIYGKSVDVPIGKNTRFDKENNLVRSEVDGHAEIGAKGVIDVNNVLKISGSVDNSTGNLFFVGDIIIGKDVTSGFKVESQGSIMIQGTVEGAYIKAKGDITVGQSINGMNRARITTEGNLRCKYIQYCHVETGESIYAECIMHATIECGGSMELSGRRGSIIGGKLVISKALHAKAIGTESHVATHITVAGGGLLHNKRILDIKKQINAVDTETIMLVQTMNWCESLLKKGMELKPFQLNAYEHGRDRIEAIKVERAEKLAALEESQRELNKVDPAESYVMCSGRIHTGVKITFGIHTLTVQASFANSRVFLSEGEIIISS